MEEPLKQRAALAKEQMAPDLTSFHMKFDPFMKGTWDGCLWQQNFRFSNPPRPVLAPHSYARGKRSADPRKAVKQGRWPITQPACHLRSIFLTTIWQAYSRAAFLLLWNISLYILLYNARKSKFIFLFIGIGLHQPSSVLHRLSRDWDSFW